MCGFSYRKDDFIKMILKMQRVLYGTESNIAVLQKKSIKELRILAHELLHEINKNQEPGSKKCLMNYVRS